MKIKFGGEKLQTMKKSKTQFKNVLLVLVLAMFLFIGCQNENEVIPGNAETMEELTASNQFKWETSTKIVFDIDAVSVSPGYYSRISVFTEDPAKGGELIMNGSASEELYFTNEVQVPSNTERLYVMCVFPSGNSKGLYVETAEGYFKHTFTEVTETKSAQFLTGSTSPVCSEGCSEIVTKSSGDIVVEKNKTVCLTGNFSGGITFRNEGGILRICGNAILQNINVNGGAKMLIEITGSGSLQTNNLNLNSSSNKISNWGVLAISSNFSPQGTIENYGTFNVSGYNNNSGGVLKNYGIINISGNFNNNATIENSGSLVVSGHFNNNGQATLINSCKLTVTGDFTNNATLTNTSYIYAGGTFTVNSGGKTELSGGAMVKTKKLMVNSKINGSGNYSSLNILDNTTINGSGSITGQIDICDENGIERNNGTIAGSITYCKIYIPVSDCNPSGIGQPSIPDSDHDGIPDDKDEFPNDDQSAFSSYFPNASTPATLLFEDLWPSKGDYDFNDLVVEIKGTYFSNAANKITSLKFFLNVKAVGASNKNGLGIQFDNLPASAITSVTGTRLKNGSNISLNNNGTEAGQENAVVIAVENVEDVLHRAGGSMFNTVENGFVGTSDLVEITISFAGNPISFDLIKSSSFNFFLIKNQDRSTEIHLADRRPTNLMSSVFGESSDTSDPSMGRYFKTKNNLPWGLLILNSFQYPVEKVPVIEAYPEFQSWAESDGNTYTNWYNNPNASKVW